MTRAPRETSDRSAPTEPHRGVPRRVSLLLALATIGAGLGARAVLPEHVGGPLGDVLFATLLVWVAVLLLPRLPAPVAALLAFSVCVAVEVSHLTPYPGQVLEQLPAARYVLGTTFDATDLGWYALGALLGGMLVPLARRRRRSLDRDLRHGRAAPLSPRWRRRVMPTLASLVAVALLAGSGLVVHTTLATEADALSARVTEARTELDGARGRVLDDGALSSLAVAIDDATDLLTGLPVLERMPGDAPATGERLDGAVDVVHESRRAYAVDEIATVRDEAEPVQRRATRVLTAADELADDGQDAGTEVRAAARVGIAAVDGLLGTTAEDALADLDHRAIEDATVALTTAHEDLDAATVELMTAQDAVTCPEDDQLWFPQSGRLAESRLAAIPWAPEHQVRADILDSLVALNEDYRAHFGVDLTVNSAYRSYEQQLRVSNPADPNPLAAPPGCSNHGLGTAVDFSVGPEGFDGERYQWLQQHAGQHGWVHPAWAGPNGRLPEPWHWESVETPVSY